MLFLFLMMGSALAQWNHTCGGGTPDATKDINVNVKFTHVLGNCRNWCAAQAAEDGGYGGCCQHHPTLAAYQAGGNCEYYRWYNYVVTAIPLDELPAVALSVYLEEIVAVNTPPLPGWYLADGPQSCTDVCSNQNQYLTCDASKLNEITSLEAFQSAGLDDVAGTDCSISDEHNAKYVPYVGGNGKCWWVMSDRARCGNEPAGSSDRRVCYCKLQSPVEVVDTSGFRLATGGSDSDDEGSSNSGNCKTPDGKPCSPGRRLLFGQQICVCSN